MSRQVSCRAEVDGLRAIAVPGVTRFPAMVPVSGQIRRFDGDTLEARPPVGTVFGARGLAVDPVRDLLRVSCFPTNKVDAIDLKTGQSPWRCRLGLWMRAVRVVSETGVAYGASRYGLYRLNYLA